MRTFIKKFKNSILGKLLKIIFKLITWALELLIICIALVIIIQRFTNNEKSFFGFRIFSVASGSMRPVYDVGDVLIAKEKEPSEIEKGDNIVYLGNKSDFNGKIITHQVVDTERDENGDYLFRTKGTANAVEDPIVHEDQVYGIVVQNNYVIALLFKIISSKYGLYFLVILPLILYVFIGFVRVQDEKMKEEREIKRIEKEKRKKKKEEVDQEEISEEVDEEIAQEEIAEKIEQEEKTKKTKKKTSKSEEEQEEKTKKTRKTTSKKKEEQLEESKEVQEETQKPKTKRKKTKEE